MVVVTRPELGEKLPEDHAEPVGPPEAMNVRLANALVTGAPMTMTQLHTAREFYGLFAAMHLQAGPTFSPSRATAIKLHNLATDRINGVNEERRRREREALEDRLLPIER